MRRSSESPRQLVKRITSPATAVVLLPSREAAVTLPEPPVETIEDMMQWEIDRIANESSAAS